MRLGVPSSLRVRTDGPRRNGALKKSDTIAFLLFQARWAGFGPLSPDVSVRVASREISAHYRAVIPMLRRMRCDGDDGRML